MRRLIITVVLMLVVGVSTTRAQSGGVTIAVKGGDNALFGAFASLSGEVRYEAAKHFALRGGAQYNTIGRAAAEVRPQYFHDFDFGRLGGELLFNYAYQIHMNSFAVGCGVSLDIRRIWVTIGYYCRTMTMAASKIGEPFNIYYELGVRCLPKRERWDLNVMISNSQIFELERHYQPSFALEGWWYPLAKLGVQMSVNYKPAGMFNMSSDYYQFYADLGVCYKW